jgi:hypothetical protein
MFKITAVHETTESLVLRLEGRLVSDSIGELLTACGNAVCPQGRCVELNVAGVSFADDVGIETLRRLASRGLKVTKASPFLAELLREN